MTKMKKRIACICGVVCFLLSLGAGIPCELVSPRSTDFEDVAVGSYRRLLFGFGTHGVVTITTQSGECLEVREVDQTIHNDFLGERAFAVSEPVVIDFEEQDNWGIAIYLGADTFDDGRHPHLQCYARPGLPTGGDYGIGLFGPEAFIDEQEEPTYPYQYLFYLVMRQPFGDYFPLPIDFCIVEPGGEDVFLSAMHYVVDAEEQTATAVLGRREKGNRKGGD